MEIANSGLQHLQIRRAEERDLPKIAEMMQHAPYNHIHVDWRLPRYWLDTGAFVVAETEPAQSTGSGILLGCLAVGADPPPGAWVRVAALRGRRLATPLLQTMLLQSARRMAEDGVTEIGWLPRSKWPQEWMEALGFTHVDEVVTYVKNGVEIPDKVRHNERVHVRDVAAGDMPHLAEIERAAFEPLWRHSIESLSIGWQHSLSFHAAELDGRLVGFQYSSDSDVPHAGHLVRLTVDPNAQRSGVGSALLRAALESYRRRNLQEASLNTQLSNEPSRHLYEKFGFKPAGYHWPVWSWPVEHERLSDL